MRLIPPFSPTYPSGGCVGWRETISAAAAATGAMATSHSHALRRRGAFFSSTASRAAACVAAQGEAVVGGHPVDPRQRRVPVLQSGGVAHELPEDLLGHVPGGFPVAEQAQAPPVDGGAVRLVELCDPFPGFQNPRPP